ncbi:hypothetical protein DMC30DRAFT_419512 [Rhodotorula diobovata]|uniref:RlpA-like double-psi beta-barrel-protein domain-containing protein-containing protein n=1 Tax=Rhodotorula diobovata TaxID=5288 RepID=A0A5C5FLP7_9BASI|nr:hypothetical protein DMC30DRAFT_419512 [Rhodotorula diobovata]
MRTSITLAALGASALAPAALALSYSTGHLNPALAKPHHQALAERAAGVNAAAAALDKRSEERNASVAKRGRMERKVRRSDSSSSSGDAKSTVYESVAIYWASTGWTNTCGKATSDDAMIIGLPLAVYPDVSAASPLCGTSVTVTAKSTGKQITASVIGASNRDDYTTFSRGAYLALGGDLDVGMLDIEFSLGDETAAEVVQSASASKASVSSVSSSSSSKAAASSSAAPVVAASSSNVEADEENDTESTSQASPIARVASSSASPAQTTTAAPTTSARPTTTQQPTTATTTTTSAWDSDSYYSSSSAAAAAAKSKADAEWAASSSSSAEAYQLWASSSSAAAASKASADAAWASSSSAAAAAAASSSKAAADAAWASSSSAAAAAKETQSSSNSGSSSSGGSGKVYSGGIATFFYQNGNCGQVNSDSTLLVALPTNTYAGGSHCGKYVSITRTATGQSIKALVADSCPTCNNDSCLDLSWGAFSALGGTESMGVFDITWQFV